MKGSPGDESLKICFFTFSCIDLLLSCKFAILSSNFDFWFSRIDAIQSWRFSKCSWLAQKRLWNFALKSIPDWHQIGFRSFCSPAEFRFGREKFSKTGLRVMAHLSRWNKPLASRYFNWSLRPSFATMYRKYAYEMDQNNNLNKDFQSVERP